MIILGLSGKARTGKSRLCKELYDAAERLGWDIEIKPFAGPLKKHVVETLGFTKESNPSMYRKYCQKIGAEERKKDPDYWVKLWHKDMLEEFKTEMETSERPVLYLVDDVRYANEIKTLNRPDVNATILFVKHGKRQIEDPDGAWRQHESENLANTYEKSPDEYLKNEVGYHFVVHNDKPEEEIQKWATNFISYLAASDPCLCETCVANYEMREPNIDKIDEELKEFLNDLLGEEDEEDGDA